MEEYLTTPYLGCCLQNIVLHCVIREGLHTLYYSSSFLGPAYINIGFARLTSVGHWFCKAHINWPTTVLSKLK